MGFLQLYERLTTATSSLNLPWNECPPSIRSVDFRHQFESAKDPSRRKLRLFLCACCRELWPARNRDGIAIAERFADGLATWDELHAASLRFTEALNSAARSSGSFEGELAYCAFHFPSFALHLFDDSNDEHVVNSVKTIPYLIAWDATASQQELISKLFHDVYSVPANRAFIDERCLTSTVTELATAIYEYRDFERMPILADALMDAGCQNADILEHCRGGRLHSRGCWVIDLLLNKS